MAFLAGTVLGCFLFALLLSLIPGLRSRTTGKLVILQDMPHRHFSVRSRIIMTAPGTALFFYLPGRGLEEEGTDGGGRMAWVMASDTASDII
jgi:hypothetical protein